jgi:ABC-type transporter Mla subunit MlaD
MHMLNLGLIVELALTGLLAVTLVYCIVLERRLAAVRRGQEGLKSTIGELNSAITNAGAAMRALKATASGAAETLDERLARSRSVIDELSLLTASGERIAERFDRASDASAASRAPAAASANGNLPSGSIMKRLDALRAVR